MKRLLIISLASLSIACTSVKTPTSEYITFGQANITECEQMVFPDGQKGDKEAIGFNCKRYESKGVSGEFAGILVSIIKIIPGLPWLTQLMNGS